MPLGHLIDWIDQAALQVFLDPPDDHNGRDKFVDRSRLRRLGIRTATDLESAFLAQDCLAEWCSSRAVCKLADTRLVEGIRRVLNNDSNLPGINVVDGPAEEPTRPTWPRASPAQRGVHRTAAGGIGCDGCPRSGSVGLAEDPVAAVS